MGETTPDEVLVITLPKPRSRMPGSTQRRTVHVARHIGGEEHHAVGDVVRLPQPAERNPLLEIGALVGLAQVGLVDLGPDRARQDRIATDPVRPQRNRARLH